MPEMNGFEATEYIRHKMNSKIPIIALTADVTTVDLAKCKAAGMNDYIAKPIDEKLLYSKIVGLVKKPMMKYQPQEVNGNEQAVISRCIDLTYMIRLTKSDRTLMTQIMTIYLQQTPPLIKAMKQSVLDKDWRALYSAVHKMIPSFSVVGIHTDFENMAKKIQEYAGAQKTDTSQPALPAYRTSGRTTLEGEPDRPGITDLVLQLESVCLQACRELEEEFSTLKNSRYE